MRRPKKTVLTRIKHPRLHLTVAIVLLSAVLTQTALALVGNAMVGALPSHKAADRWSGDGQRYAQISCYLNEAAGFDKRSVQNACDRVAQLLTDNGMAANSGARLWIYGYSAEAGMGVYTDRAHISANAILTGGDFFYFRDEKLLGGSYYGEGLITDTQTVLSEDAAWQLYGSTDVVGMSVYIGDTEFTVTGVVETKEKSENLLVYLPMSAYERIYGSAAITCVEFLLPDPVSGFAVSLVERSVTAGEKYLVVTDHRARYEMGTLYKYLGDFTSVLVPEKQVFYPAWEQNERKLEFTVAVMLIGRTVCFAAIAVCLFIELVMLYMVKDAVFAAVRTFAVDTKDRIQEKHWENRKKRKAEKAERRAAVSGEKKAQRPPKEKKVKEPKATREKKVKEPKSPKVKKDKAPKPSEPETAEATPVPQEAERASLAAPEKGSEQAQSANMPQFTP